MKFWLFNCKGFIALTYNNECSCGQREGSLSCFHQPRGLSALLFWRCSVLMSVCLSVLCPSVCLWRSSAWHREQWRGCSVMITPKCLKELVTSGFINTTFFNNLDPVVAAGDTCVTKFRTWFTQPQLWCSGNKNPTMNLMTWTGSYSLRVNATGSRNTEFYKCHWRGNGTQCG